ncbi:hypothetical protein ACFYVL_43950 [Streptomyces sp. NPDC004111]|uniref:hypothetical protein n=1 Tax=Streptomyces sp. NPDC004111 TaxID=3364690 RepID=UPI0036858D78
MTQIAHTRSYITQTQLARAYHQLGHRHAPENQWDATLLIDENLVLWWACPALETLLPGEDGPPRQRWHVIERAGELDWPPLRPEAEIWPALLERDPIPTSDQAERQAAMYGQSVEERHRESLRRHYLGSAHLGTTKRNPTDVNFDPIVRDWSVTARELADFIDTHRPPKLSTEQRVMAQGARLVELEREIARTKDSLGHLMRNAAREQGDPLPRGYRAQLARWSGVTKPTVTAWLSDTGCCEDAVPDETSTPHTHTPEDQEQTP